MKINIAAIAMRNGLINAYALQKALNCSPTLAGRLWKGNFKQIGVATLESLCDLFNCQPSDLLVYTPRSSSTKPPAKPLALSAASRADGEMLSTIQVAERLNLSRKSVNDFIIKGLLPATKGKQGHNFISESDLVDFISKRNQQS